MILYYFRFMRENIMEEKALFCIFVGLAFDVIDIYFFIRSLKEIKKIKIGSNDSYVKAIVVGKYNLYITGDIRPILSYTVDGEEKKYVYHFYHTSKKYPVGKEIYLKLSNISGLAYDKKDLIQGVLFNLFRILLWSVGLLLGVYYMIFFR